MTNVYPKISCIDVGALTQLVGRQEEHLAWKN